MALKKKATDEDPEAALSQSAWEAKKLDDGSLMEKHGLKNHKRSTLGRTLGSCN